MVTWIDKKKDDVQKHKSIWIAEQLWQQNQDIIFCNGTFYQWEGRVYKKIDDMDWMIEMVKRFPAFEESAPSKQKEILEVYKRFSKIDQDELNKEDGLCFKNVYLNLKDLSVHEHNKTRINTILIPYEYDNKAECPLWMKSISEIFQEDLYNINCLQEFFGYCLTRDVSHEKAMLLIGESRTGKSTILNALASMVGDENTSALSLRFFKDSMRLCTIENKLALINHETPKRLEDYEAEFRQIVSGQIIEVNPKFTKPYKINPFCKIIVAMNEIPRIDDHSKAFFERLLPIECTKEFKKEERDKKLSYKLRTERAGILNWAIVGLARLRENKDFTEDEFMMQKREEIRNQNNPIALWAAENIIVKLGMELIKGEAYKKYTIWCGINGYKPTSSSKFGHEMYRIYKNVTEKAVRQSSGYERKYVWPNLAWMDSESAVEEQKVWEE